MSKRTARVVLVLLGAAALPLSACTDDDTTDPAEAVAGTTLLDVAGTLEAIEGAADTLRVNIPRDRFLGAIIESSAPILARYGPGRFDAIWSGYTADAFGAIVPQVGTGAITLVVMRSTTDVVEARYRIRIVAVNDEPEHAEAQVRKGADFRSEWIDPPLDLDVFAVNLEEGEQFFIEAETQDEDVTLTASVVPPDGLPWYAFLAAGTRPQRSEVREAARTGEHLILFYSTGLEPDIEATYRFRVVVSSQ